MTLAQEISEREPRIKKEAQTKAMAYLRKRTEEKIIECQKAADKIAGGFCLGLMALLVGMFVYWIGRGG